VFHRKDYARFVLPNILYFVGLNLFFFIDVWIVKYHLTDLSLGLYVSASALAKLPYLVSVGLSAVLLPSVSHAAALKNEKRVRDISFEAIRYVLIFLFLIILLVTTHHRPIVELFFGHAYSEAGSVLAVLITGTSLLTLMAVVHTILISFGLMMRCFIQIAGLLVIHVALNVSLVPRFGMLGAAVSTVCVGGVGVVFGFVWLRKKLHAFLWARTLLKLVGVGMGFIVIYYLGRGIFPHGILGMTALAALYVFAMILLKEIDLLEMRRWLKPQIDWLTGGRE
jgi:O-antigen/teichoic acid export membrane protein